MYDMTDNDPSSYKLSLKGEGIALERDVPKDIALSVINIVLGSPTKRGTSSTGEAGQPPPEQSEAKARVTPGEFIEEQNAGTNPEKIAAFGLYLKDMRGQENFTREDIKAMFREAHETAPANFGRDFRAALTSNWIAVESDSSDRYFVTTTGRKAVNDQFAAARPRKPRRKSARANTETGER